MKVFMKTMGVYWITLLSVSLGCAALIYFIWLKDKLV